VLAAVEGSEGFDTALMREVVASSVRQVVGQPVLASVGDSEGFDTALMREVATSSALMRESVQLMAPSSQAESTLIR
jgi:hypothetical protein